MKQMPPRLPGVTGVEEVPTHDEHERDDDEEAEVAVERDGHHHGELEHVHELVERTLNAVHNTALALRDRLQKYLRDSQVSQPQT